MVALLNAWRNLDREVKAIELKKYALQVRRLDATRTRHNMMVVIGREGNVIRVAFVTAVNWQRSEITVFENSAARKRNRRNAGVHHLRR